MAWEPKDKTKCNHDYSGNGSVTRLFCNRCGLDKNTVASIEVLKKSINYDIVLREVKRSRDKLMTDEIFACRITEALRNG